jgi:hypothetical protein
MAALAVLTHPLGTMPKAKNLAVFPGDTAL